MKKFLAGLAIVGLLTVSVGACGGSAGSTSSASAPRSADAPNAASPTPSVTPNASYASVAALRDAAIAAGYACPHWREDDKVTLAAQSGSCSSSDVLSTYASTGGLQSQLDQYKENSRMLSSSGIDPGVLLVGPNWIISADSGLGSLPPVIGGTLVAPHD